MTSLCLRFSVCKMGITILHSSDSSESSRGLFGLIRGGGLEERRAREELGERWLLANVLVVVAVALLLPLSWLPHGGSFQWHH